MKTPYKTERDFDISTGDDFRGFIGRAFLDVAQYEVTVFLHLTFNKYHGTLKITRGNDEYLVADWLESGSRTRRACCSERMEWFVSDVVDSVKKEFELG